MSGSELDVEVEDEGQHNAPELDSPARNTRSRTRQQQHNNNNTTINSPTKSRPSTTSSKKSKLNQNHDPDSFLFGDDEANVDVEEFTAGGTGGSQAPMTSSGETPFDRALRIYVNEPVLKFVPFWITPNGISYFNVFVCWFTLALSFEAYRTEHEYQTWSFICRIGLAITVFISLVLDCLDGMQARRTNRCSKLGEVLDHGFDAANAPIMCASLLISIGPDDYSLAIGLVATSMIYNAQLIIYRHHRIMINGPVNGPEAQMLVSLSHFAFGVLFYLADRQSYTVQTIVQVFCLVSNITQFSNCWFFFKHLTRSFDEPIAGPHIRFSIQAGAFALLYLLGVEGLTRTSFVIGSILIAFRLNGLYVLLTIAQFRTMNTQQFKQAMTHSDLPWYPEVLAGIALVAVGPMLFPPTLLFLLTGAFYVSLIVLNVRDLLHWKDQLMQ